ncbi:MAG: stage II sporulation protein P [Clostridia bacterium]|nr:stage II sporulation protein P [Clostridia bacterium]
MQKKTRLQNNARKLERGVIIFALILRLITTPSVYAAPGRAMQTLAEKPGLGELLGYLYSGTRFHGEQVQKRGGTVTVTSLKKPEPEGLGQLTLPALQTQSPKAEFVSADVSSIRIIGSCTYSYDTQALLSAPLKVHFSSDAPQVLIVHTHTTEGYAECAGEDYSSLDPLKNVVAVGDVIAEVLTQNGIPTLHETGLNDVYGYQDAYERMDAVIADYLAKYPSIQMVIDVHRDSFEDSSGNIAGPVVTEAGMECAKLMLVMGTDEGGLYHPNWQDNLSCALKLQSMLLGTYPSLCRDLLLRQSRYNQHRTPCSMLVEIGASGNTLLQAQNTARLFAECVSSLIIDNTAEKQRNG